MGIVNRRNALTGWLVLKLTKRVARRKAKAVGPHALDAAVRRPKALVAFFLAAGAGAATLLRHRHGGRGQA